MPTVYSQEFKQLALRLMEDHLHHTQCSQWSAAQGEPNAPITPPSLSVTATAPVAASRSTLAPSGSATGSGTLSGLVLTRS